MKLLIKTLKITAIAYVTICILLYFFQEKLIFFPEKLAKNYSFEFDRKFEEKTIQTKDGKRLNAVLFKADSSKGVVFYLHGNAGSLASWGEVANLYTGLNYDVLMLDYRGFGKSEGSITNQNELFQDIQSAYDFLKNSYPENKIIVLGYSIGSGLAAKVASSNHPKLLILQAPYYSLIDMMRNNYPIIPTFILKYKLETNNYIKECKMPIVIFHGNQDEVIPYESSLRLQKEFKKEDRLFTLNGQEHNGMTENKEYQEEISTLLKNTP